MFCSQHVAPTEAPLIVSLDADSPFSFIVSWDPPSLDHRNGRIVSYHLYITEWHIPYIGNISLDPEELHTRNVTYDTPANYTQLIDNLQPHHNYSVRIATSTRIVSPNGNTRVAIGPFSNRINVTTWENGE